MDARRWSVTTGCTTIELDFTVSERLDVHLFRPVAILAVLGAVIAILGLFVAGNIAMVGIGLLAVFGAGLLDVIAIRRVRP